MDEAKENDWLNIAKEAAKKAGEKILQIYGNEFSVSYKEDKSPLTIATVFWKTLDNGWK